MIAALGLDGVHAPLVLPGGNDTTVFQTYVEQALVPELHPGDVVVFDNLKPHLMAAGVTEAIEGAGARVLPLPPYSPDSVVPKTLGCLATSQAHILHPFRYR